MKKKTFFVLLLIVSLFITVSCGNKKVAEEKPTQPVEVVKTEQVVQPEIKEVTKVAEPVVAPVVNPVPVNETVVVKEATPEPEVVPEPETKVVETIKEAVKETVKETVEEVKKVFEPIVYNFDYAGFKAKGVFDEASALITFDGNLSAKDFTGVVGEILAKHPELQKLSLKYSVKENPLRVYLTYPMGSTVEDLQYAIKLVSSEIDSAVASYIEKTTPKKVEPVVEPVVEQVVEPAPVVAEPVAVEPAPVVIEPVVESAPVVAEPVAVEPTPEVVEPEKIKITNSFKLVLSPINLVRETKYKYSFGAEGTYECRLNDMFGAAGSLVYNIYFDKNNPGFIVSDHAFIVDLLAYGHMSDKVLFNAGMGAGLNMFREGSKVEWDFIMRLSAGVEVQLTDHFALTYGVGMNLTIDEDCTTVFQPARVGVSFRF